MPYCLEKSSLSEEKLRLAVQTYYEAVVNENCNYTYDHLDSQTRQQYNRGEQVQKNQLFAVQCPIKRTVPNIDAKVSSSEVNVSVTLIFTNYPTKYRITSFVYEDGARKHRELKEELDLFMPGAPYDQFVKANSQGRPDRCLIPSTTPPSTLKYTDAAWLVRRGHEREL